MPDADPAHYVRGQYDGYRDIDGVEAGLHDRDVRRHAAGDRQLALDRRAVLHPDRQAACRSRRPSCGSCSTRRRGSGFHRARVARAGGRPARHQARPDDRRPAPLRGAAGRRRGGARAGAHGPRVRRPGRRGRDARTRCCCTRRCSATARASSARTASRRRGGSWSRCSTPRRRCIPTSPGRGDRRPRTPWSRATVAGTTRGWRHDRRPRRRGSSQSLVPPVAVPADRRLRVPVGLPHRRARRAGRLDRLALRAQLRRRRACSARSWTAGRDRSGFGPFGINAPAARSYVPGTNVLTTTWHTPTGWIVVRDALDDGPEPPARTRSRRTRGRRPTRTPSTCWSARSSASRAASSVELVCEPVFDYGRAPAEWSLVDGSRHTADATGAGATIRLQTDLSVGIEGNRVRARHVLRKGERAYCSLSWAEELASPDDVEQADAAIEATTTLLARVARPRPAARPPLARADPALGAGDQGPDLHAHRRDRRRARRPRCRRRRAASATGTTATRGCATRRSRSRRCTG